MEKLSFSKFSSSPSSAVPPPFVVSPYLSLCKARRRVSFTLSNPKKFSVFASKSGPNDDDKLNQWDLMELKFGQMLGEDPKLTLAKVISQRYLLLYYIFFVLISLQLCICFRNYLIIIYCAAP